MTIVELASQHKWNLPTECPICKGELVINDNHTKIRCANPTCSSKVLGRLSKWISKMEIKEVAEATLETFMRVGLIDPKNPIYSLYNIKESDISKLEGFGDRSARIIVSNIQKANKARLAKYLAGFNIEACGERVIQKILSNISEFDIQKVLEIAYENPSAFICEGIGEKTAIKFAEGLKALSDDIRMSQNFVAIEPEPAVNTNGKFVGMSFCFTGKAEAIGSRKVCEELVVKNGGTISSVKKGLTYLVTDDTDSGSSKNIKAKQLGVKTITSYEFKDMLNS